MLPCLTRGHTFSYSFLHCPSFLLFFFSPLFLFISRNTQDKLSHWRKHRMLATNIVPWPWQTPHYRCHWATERWVKIRRGHHKWSHLSLSIPTNTNIKTCNSWSYIISTFISLRTRTKISITEARSSFPFCTLALLIYIKKEM